MTMKTLLLAAALLILLSGESGAVPCPAHNYAFYLGLQQTGCTVNNVVFSGFTYAVEADGGVAPVLPDSISVTPIATNGEGLQFAGEWRAVGGQTLDLQIGYNVAFSSLGNSPSLSCAVGVGLPGVPPEICEESLTLLDPAVTATAGAAIRGLARKCKGAEGLAEDACTFPFLLVQLPEDVLEQSVFVTATANKTSDVLSFPSIDILGVRMRIVVDGGSGAGFAELRAVSVVEARVLVSEPPTVLLLGIGLLGMLGYGRRSRRRLIGLR